MRGQKNLLVLVMAAATALPQASSAQLSPRGLVGAVTLPLREMLGRFGHFPHRRHPAQDGPAAPAAAQFGDAGPPGWPSAYADVLGFTFWPPRYVGPLRAHGFDVIAAAMTETPRGPELARNATTGAAVESDGNANPADPCGQAGDVKIEWPVSQIEDTTTKLNDTQRAALDKLRTALAQSIKNIHAGCRDLRALPPIERLKAGVQQLWAVRDADIYIRAPLKAFYDSLSDAQKARFTWKQPDRVRADDKAANGEMARQYQACAAPSEQASERLLTQIEQQVRPTEQQADAMQSLRKTASDMAKLMTAPCAQAIPTDPLARLDAASDQLSSMSYAATSVEIALAGFSAQLDGEQKAKFDSLGR